ncbi:hypothetical protein SAMN04488243_101124 [Thermus arciformis]|uniref:DUF4398 domain-containing protein n=1 Tax=Thermus arciformis TaxID=482827 RepID=A0A1G7CR03_9DEIN|nr:hypothetical protein [Thermus arciformis]SDE41663.1 hypothetical protein SAMN04488243_101124 [Thermus arciformis]
MRKAFFGFLILLAGLSLAQGTDYRQAALAASALARLQAVAQGATGEEKLLSWAKELKARAEKSYEAKAYFKAAREAQAALLLYRAAQGEPKAPMGYRHGRGPRDWGYRGRDLPARLGSRAQALVDRAEKELAYYRAQDALVKALVAEAKGRLEKEPGRALLLAQAALALISAERGF